MCMRLCAATFWSIWKLRNSLCFQGRSWRGIACVFRGGHGEGWNKRCVQSPICWGDGGWRLELEPTSWIDALENWIEEKSGTAKNPKEWLNFCPSQKLMLSFTFQLDCRAAVQLNTGTMIWWSKRLSFVRPALIERVFLETGRLPPADYISYHIFFLLPHPLSHFSLWLAFFSRFLTYLYTRFGFERFFIIARHANNLCLIMIFK
jgi:hypothetical protein